MDQPGHHQPVTVVIPVYRDLAMTRACLESVAASRLPADASVLVIDDASPEEALSRFCATFCQQHDYELLVNPENRGFVHSANSGLAHDATADAVLLNSDTTVAPGWLDRLRRQAYAAPDIGTVTPFSNNGTICSYPVFNRASELPAGWSAAALDALCAAANPGQGADIPTAVGFCMYIRRDCLDQVGLFDTEHFGQGYGEECDFSLRAAAAGWRNRLAADVFVYHAGSASFGNQSNARKEAADQVMQALHPDYEQQVDQFLQEDPLYPYRLRIDLKRLQENPGDAAQVLDEHTRYARSLVERGAATRLERQQLLTQRASLEALLDATREEFTATDTALREATAIVENQQRELRQLDAQAQALTEHIAQMEQSRSWRYTRWLRRRR